MLFGIFHGAAEENFFLGTAKLYPASSGSRRTKGQGTTAGNRLDFHQVCASDGVPIVFPLSELSDFGQSEQTHALDECTTKGQQFNW